MELLNHRLKKKTGQNYLSQRYTNKSSTLCPPLNSKSDISWKISNEKKPILGQKILFP